MNTMKMRTVMVTGLKAADELCNKCENAESEAGDLFNILSEFYDILQEGYDYCTPELAARFVRRIRMTSDKFVEMEGNLLPKVIELINVCDDTIDEIEYLVNLDS